MKPPLAHRPYSRSGVLGSRVVVRASSLHPRSRRQLVAALLFLNLTWLPAALGLEVLWRDSFEGFNLQLRWEITAGVWEMGNPTTGPGAPPPGGGTNVAATVLNGNCPEGVDTWLIRRQSFRVPESNPRLRFRHWFNFNWDDYGQVQVREVGGEWETLATYPQVLWTCGRWEPASLSLAKYAGKELQIAFLFHSSVHSNGREYVAEGWYLDDVEIVSAPLEFRNPENFESPDFWDLWYTDNGVWEVGVPTGAPAERHDGSQVAGTIIDGNYCDAYFGRDSRLISAWAQIPAVPNPRLRFRHWFNFYWDDYGQVQVREAGGEWETLATYPQVLWTCGRWERASLNLSKYAGKELQIAFLFHSSVHSNGKEYVAEGWYLDDVEVVSAPLEFRNPEGFEAPDFWDLWYTDNGVWEVGVPSHGPTNAFQGVRVAGTILDGDYCDAYYGRDSRLIGPWLHLPLAGSPTLTFQHWYDFSLDDFGAVEVRTPDGSWEEVSRFTANSAGKWYPASSSLAKYAGKDVQIAFRFHSQINSNGRSYVAPGWYLDQLEIRTGLLRVEPEAILFEGLVLDELTTGTFWARGALPGWRYGLAEGAPDGAAMDPDLGLFTWIPAECQGPALTFITLALFNEQNQPMDLLEVPVIVLEVDEAPRIGTISDLRIDAGVPVALDVSRYAYDPDCPAQVLTYSLDTPSPSNAAVDPQTGVLDWIPTAEQAAQTNTLILRVTDDTGVSATRTVRAGPFDVNPTAPRIGQLRLAGNRLELTLLDVTPGQVIRLEATAALQNPATATVWTEVRSFTWQTNPVMLEGIINGDHPAEFFRLNVSGQR